MEQIKFERFWETERNKVVGNRPLEKYPLFNNTVFCDFETTNVKRQSAQNTVHIYLWSMITGWDGAWYYGTTLDSFFNQLYDFKRRLDVWFHNGAKFDFHYLIHQFTKKDEKGKLIYRQNFKQSNVLESVESSDYMEQNRRSEWKPFDFVITTDNTRKIFEITTVSPFWRRKHRKGKEKGLRHYRIRFRDSALLFPNSLKNYGEQCESHYQTKITKGDFRGYLKIYRPYQSIGGFRRGVKNANQHIEYIRNDTHILSMYLLMMSKKLPYNRWRITAPSTAYREWLTSLVWTGENKLGWLGEKFKQEIQIKKYRGDYQKFIYQGGEKKPLKTHQLAQKLILKVLPLKWLNEKLGSEYQFDLMRRFYRGGLTYTNPKWQGVFFEKKDKVKISGLDINSSYPNVMLNKKFPYGNPVPENEGQFHFYRITAQTEIINENGLPFLPALDLPNNPKYFAKKTLYPTKIPVGVVCYVSTPEWEQVKKWYKGKWKKECLFSFKAIEGKTLFGAYMMKYWNMKKLATAKKDVGLKVVCKLFLNSLYGKLASKNNRKSKIFNPNLTDGYWEQIEQVEKAKYYLPIGCAITAYARMELVKGVDNKRKYFLYCDTDSVYVAKPHLFDKLKIGVELGEWKVEYQDINQFIFRCRKQYLLIEKNGTPHITFAGLSLRNEKIELSFLEPEFDKRIKEKATITWDMLREGGQVPHQLRPSRKIIFYGKYLEEYTKEIHPVWHKTHLGDPDIWFKTRQEWHSKHLAVKDDLKKLLQS